MTFTFATSESQLNLTMANKFCGTFCSLLDKNGKIGLPKLPNNFLKVKTRMLGYRNMLTPFLHDNKIHSKARFHLPVHMSFTFDASESQLSPTMANKLSETSSSLIVNNNQNCLQKWPTIFRSSQK